MKHIHQSIISLLCTAALLTSSVSCSSSNAESVSDALTAETNADTSETIENAEETETEGIPLNLPEMHFDGQEMRFLTRDHTADGVVRYYSEVASFEENGEVMNDAVCRRTFAIEEDYDVKITSTIANDVPSTFRKTYKAGEDNWEVICGDFGNMAKVAVKGEYFTNLGELPYIDFDNPWWDSQVAEELSIAGKTYIAIGAMNTWTDSHTFAVIFNKELAEQFAVNPYEMVDNNEWTIDRFSEILQDVTSDVDGNGIMDENDRYGACSAYFNFLVHMTGCGVQIIDHDENGIPRYTFDERFYSAAEKVSSVMNGGGCLHANDYTTKVADPYTDIIRKNFRRGNSLFYVGGIEQLLIFRDLDTDIGLLPVPKYDETDDYAHTFSDYWSSIMAVPSICQNKDMASYLLEAMNYESSITDAAAYFDVVLSHKAMRDEDSIRMLKIIRSTRTMNFEYAFSFLNVYQIYVDVMKNKDTSAISSSIAKALSAAEEKIEKMAAYSKS